MPLSLDERQAVQDLIVRYAFAVDDAADEAAFLNLFTEDAMMDGPNGQVHGISAVKQLSHIVKATAGRQSRHLITNLLIDGDGDSASISAYFFRVKTPVDGRTDPVAELSVGTYRCIAKKIAGTWKLQRRVVHIDGI